MMNSDNTTGVPLSADARRWMDALFVRMFQLLHVFETDNFDESRYRGESAQTFYYDRHAAYFSFFVRNADYFFRARKLLFDDASRELLDQLILFRFLGHLHVRLPFNTSDNRARRAIIDSWKLYDTPDAGLFGPLAVFSVPTEAEDIAVKCWIENVEATFLVRPYYFDRGGESIAPVPGDHVVDAGGCFGDTALAFAQTVGKSGHVYTFDPLPKHCEIMRENFAMNPALSPRISIFEVGVADENRVGSNSHAADGVINPGANVFGGEISTRTIDSLVTEGVLPRIDFVKMDIEGSELGSLMGAEGALRKWTPRLAISLYHRPEDLFTIPLWIDALGCGYRLFLDHYSIHHEETVLYATT